MGQIQKINRGQFFLLQEERRCQKCLPLSLFHPRKGKGARDIRRIFAKGGNFDVKGGGKNFDPLFFSLDFHHFNANFLHFALFLDIFRIQGGGKFCPPWLRQGGASLTNFFPGGGGTCPPLVVCADAPDVW